VAKEGDPRPAPSHAGTYRDDGVHQERGPALGKGDEEDAQELHQDEAEAATGQDYQHGVPQHLKRQGEGDARFAGGGRHVEGPAGPYGVGQGGPRPEG